MAESKKRSKKPPLHTEEYMQIVQTKQELLEQLGVDASMEVYKSLINMAIEHKDKDAIKFIVSRTVPARFPQFIKIPNCPPINTIDNIQIASELVHDMLINGKLTIDEAKGLIDIYENVRSIIASQQLKVIANEIKLMKENMIKRESMDVLMGEIKDRLNDLDENEKIQKVQELLNLDSLDFLLLSLKNKVKTANDKIIVLKFLKEVCT